MSIPTDLNLISQEGNQYISVSFEGISNDIHLYFEFIFLFNG